MGKYPKKEIVYGMMQNTHKHPLFECPNPNPNPAHTQTTSLENLKPKPNPKPETKP